MSTSSSCRSEPGFDLFDQERDLLRQVGRVLEENPEDPPQLREVIASLTQALEQSAREQRRLMRNGDRQQEQLRLVTRELQEKSRLLEDQARHLMVLNTELAHEVEARKTLEVELRVMASTDPLTGVYNRRRFAELGKYELSRELRNRRGLSLLALDLDHFKQVNDTHGHGVGDETLVNFARICTTCLRSMDTLGRLGGEEFALLLPETTLQDACEVGERIRQAMAECRLQGSAGPFRVTVSVGAAQLQDGESLEALAERADARLYEAKRKGRNRVEC